MRDKNIMKLLPKTKFLAYVFLSFACIIKAEEAHCARTTSSMVIDALTGDIIHSHNADERRYPASLTKLMTLYLTFNALEKGDITFNTQLTTSYKAASQEPSYLGLLKGDTISVKDAILALIVKSANDCAVVLAEGIGGNEKNFVEMMNQTAKKLGMKNTTFKNPNGLHHKDQKSTARDMAILASAVYHHYPEYYEMFSTKNFKFRNHTFRNHNHLLKHFKGADGMKTGYYRRAGYNIITSAQWDDKRVIAVTMGHQTGEKRDLKVADLMKDGLTKLTGKKSGIIYAKLDIPSLNQNDNNSWGIQIGAFSNYVKARNYALMVQNDIHQPYANKTKISVETASDGAAVVYRSQINGFAKNEADKTCYSLKKTNKSCIVIKTTQNKQLAMVD